MVTPLGTVMGRSPIRDILVHLAKDLAAELATLRFSVGHETLGRGEDAGGEAVSNRLQLVARFVNAQTRLAHAGKVVDERLPLRIVAHVHLDGGELALCGDFVAGDVTLGLKDLENFDFDFAVRNVDGGETGLSAVSDTRQKVRDGIAMHRMTSWFLTSWTSSRLAIGQREPSPEG